MRGELQNGMFFWNVEHPVGLRSPNRPIDVLFVQWCFRKASRWAELPSALRVPFNTVDLSGSCLGMEGDSLVVAIQAHQRETNKQIDGRINPARGGGYRKRGLHHEFVVVELNAILRAIHPDIYPRLDRMSHFDTRLRDAVTEPFI